MARRFKVREAEQARGQPASEFIPALVNEHGGLGGAAAALGVSQASVSRFMQLAHYRPVVVWVEDGSEVAAMVDDIRRGLAHGATVTRTTLEGQNAFVWSKSAQEQAS